MKTLLKVLTLLIFAILLAGCQDRQAPETPAQQDELIVEEQVDHHDHAMDEGYQEGDYDSMAHEEMEHEHHEDDEYTIDE